MYCRFYCGRWRLRSVRIVCGACPAAAPPTMLEQCPGVTSNLPRVLYHLQISLSGIVSWKRGKKHVWLTALLKKLRKVPRSRSSLPIHAHHTVVTESEPVGDSIFWIGTTAWEPFIGGCHANYLRSEKCQDFVQHPPSRRA